MQSESWNVTVVTRIIAMLTWCVQNTQIQINVLYQHFILRYCSHYSHPTVEWTKNYAAIILWKQDLKLHFYELVNETIKHVSLWILSSLQSSYTEHVMCVSSADVKQNTRMLQVCVSQRHVYETFKSRSSLWKVPTDLCNMDKLKVGKVIT